MNDFRETLYTVDKQGNRKWVYPTFAPGVFFKRRAYVVYSLLFILMVLPWIPVGDSQAILLDIPHRRFSFFGTTFWATDTRFLFLLLASAGLALFFFTALLGRVWCGWACPQTVFLEFVFRPIERLFEGNQTARRKLDQQPWSLSKLRIKGLKLFVFAVISWLLSSTILAYFVGREPLLAMMRGSPADHLGMFIVTLLLMIVLLFEFGWFREQFCTVLCPYARFQSVLMDKDSVLVGYDPKRGEPRGKNDGDHGDCIDCGLCVKVCPTGIDIRNGTQLECIQCASCIDACNSVMSKIEKPQGLIRYDTERGLLEGKRHFLRPRVVIYAVALVLLLSIFSALLVTRNESEFLVMRQNKSSPFQLLPDGRISNSFKVHIGNKSSELRHYTLELVHGQGVELLTPLSPFPVAAGSDATMPLFVNFQPQRLDPKKIIIQLRDQHGVIARQELPLLTPG